MVTVSLGVYVAVCDGEGVLLAVMLLLALRVEVADEVAVAVLVMVLVALREDVAVLVAAEERTETHENFYWR